MKIIFNNNLKLNLNKYKTKFNYFALKTFKELHFDKNFIVSVTFVSEKYIKKINSIYRNINKPTDVISFAFLDDKNEILISNNKNYPIDLGEIYICYKIADKNRKKYNNSIDREICFLFVHGLLHLLGYDHIKKDDEKIMFSLQDKIFEGEVFMNKKELVEEAIKAREHSYSPYSNFKVGAAILTKDGQIIHGANIENSSFGLCNCAERNAMFNAYCQGYKKDDIVAIAVVADTKNVVSPCGACRQVMSELLNRDCKIYLANTSKKIEEWKIDDLLPFNFSDEDMKK